MTLNRPNVLRPALGALALALALLVLAQPASAQSRRRMAAGIEGALGALTSSGGEFRDGGLLASRFGVNLAYPFASRLWVVIGGDLERSWRVSGRSDSCAPRPDDGCISSLPNINGWSTSLGLRATPLARLELSALAGAGRFRTEIGEDERAIHYSTARVLHGDAAVQISSGIWLTVTGRDLRLLDPIDGARLSFRPLTLGVRLSSR